MLTYYSIVYLTTMSHNISTDKHTPV